MNTFRRWNTDTRIDCGIGHKVR